VNAGTAAAPAGASGPRRLVSLDAFRGMTIAAMILVNNPGDWAKGQQFENLAHAYWQGWTAADLIFPFFLFIVGVAIPFSFARYLAGGRTWALYRRILRRALLLVLLGLFLNWCNSFHTSVPVMRIPGVLQRIGLCYLAASLIALHWRWRGIAAWAAGLLLGYWLLLVTVPAPSAAAVDRGARPPAVTEVPLAEVRTRGSLPLYLSRGGSLPAWVDRRLFGPRLWEPAYDPEGLVSTLPAVATTLLGVLAGLALRTRRDPLQLTVWLFAAGWSLFWVGWFWSDVFPSIKALWTSSYATVSAGLALQALAFFYFVIDVRGHRRWAGPFVVFGTNAILAYVLAEVLWVALVTLGWWGPDGRHLSVQRWIYETAFRSWLPVKFASLAYSLATVALWLGAMGVLWRRRIFVKL
jgi:predicted acyltransferase